MVDPAGIERLTPLDLLMPSTYIQAVLTFETSEPTSVILPLLQQGLASVTARLPWISSHLLPVATTPGQPPSLEVRWDASHPTPVLVDKGSISVGYEDLSAQGMPPKSIPQHVSPVIPQTAEEAATIGAPIFAASVFGFSDGKALGLCVCVHHNAVDATGFTELLRLWARAMHRLAPASGPVHRARHVRLTGALLPDLEAVSAQPVDEVWASHPAYSKVPPALPSEFSPCTCELFRISIEKLDALKRQAEARTTAIPTTTNLVTALMWQAVTRARVHRNPALGEAASRLVTAVNGRGRICANFHSEDDPYFGNAVLYSLAELPVSQVGFRASKASGDGLADIAAAIFDAQSTRLINRRSIAELCSLVSRVDDYRGIFPGWDLFSSRDFTVTSWNGLDLYQLDFGTGLGKPQHVRPPYVEADGVGFVLPRRSSSGGKAAGDEAIEVMIMLRRDDMAFVMGDEAWVDLQL